MSEIEVEDVVFTCSFCPKEFSNADSLRKHKKLHTEEKPHTCLLCPRRFFRRDDLEKHLRIHTGERPYVCLVCHRAYSQSGTLARHLRTHTGEKPYGCGLCPKRFSLAVTLRRHLRVHTGEKPFGCELCPRTFAEARRLKEHQRKRHNVGQDDRDEIKICDEEFVPKMPDPVVRAPIVILVGEPSSSWQGLASETAPAHDDRARENKFVEEVGFEVSFHCSRCSRKFAVEDPDKVPRLDELIQCADCSRLGSESEPEEEDPLVESNEGDDEEKPFRCSLCEKTFSSAETLKKHLKRHSGEKPYVCSQCPVKFFRRCDLTRHVRIHTGERPYKCLVCGKAYAQSGALTGHLRTHTGEKPYSCSMCSKSYSLLASLQWHEKTHVEEKKRQNKRNPSEKTGEDDQQPKKKRHKPNCSKSETYAYDCSRCPRSFSTAEKLKRHFNFHDSRSRQEKNKKAQLDGNIEILQLGCALCSKPVALSSDESRYDVKDGTVTCASCSAKSTIEDDLDCDSVDDAPAGDVDVNTDDKPILRCSTCSKTFANAAELRKHVKNHEKSHACSMCPSGFSRPSDLRKHMRTHTGEKPYTCLLCGKAYSQSGALAGHLRTHTGDKPYKCSVCPKAFVISSMLVRHQRTHTGEKRFGCKFCSKFLSDFKHLKKHIKRFHSKEQQAPV